jgi:hypothetical protein
MDYGGLVKRALDIMWKFLCSSGPLTRRELKPDKSGDLAGTESA